MKKRYHNIVSSLSAQKMHYINDALVIGNAEFAKNGLLLL